MFQNFIGVDLWTALAILINTLLIFYVGKRKLFEPVKKMIESRTKEVEDTYARADEAQEKAESMRDEYEERLASAKKDADEIVRENRIGRGNHSGLVEYDDGSGCRNPDDRVAGIEDAVGVVA